MAAEGHEEVRLPTPVERWWSSPETSRTAVVDPLARMIAGGVVMVDEGWSAMALTTDITSK